MGDTLEWSKSKKLWSGPLLEALGALFRCKTHHASASGHKYKKLKRLDWPSVFWPKRVWSPNVSFCNLRARSAHSRQSQRVQFCYLPKIKRQRIMLLTLRRG